MTAVCRLHRIHRKRSDRVGQQSGFDGHLGFL
jgi:hypothetical protein